jgi:hypothetical protein
LDWFLPCGVSRLGVTFCLEGCELRANTTGTEGHPMSVSHAAEGLSKAAACEGERNCVGLLEMLGRLADPRSPQGKVHELVFVLACAVVATLAALRS